MARPLAESRTRAARALAAGAAPTLHLIAEAMGRAPERLMKQAKDEGWVLSPGPVEDLQARLQKVTEDLVMAMEELKLAGMAEGTSVETSHVSAISQMIGNVKKISDITRATRSVKENKPTDEDIAAILVRIDERILSLAREIAGEMAQAKSDQRGRATG
jgi:cob(I)alamin adenosyltransferase